jgi:hypothetical protein
MATKNSPAKKGAAKRSLRIKKDTIKDLTPTSRSPKGGQITPYKPGVQQTLSCAGITPYKPGYSA